MIYTITDLCANLEVFAAFSLSPLSHLLPALNKFIKVSPLAAQRPVSLLTWRKCFGVAVSLFVHTYACLKVHPMMTFSFLANM